MNDFTASLPFNINGLIGGLAQCSGVANASSSDLSLEFMVEDSFVQVLKSNLKEVRIPRSEIAEIQFRKGLFGGRIRIRLKSLKWLAELPVPNQAEITLHVKRRHRQQAADFVRVLGFQPAA